MNVFLFKPEEKTASGHYKIENEEFNHLMQCLQLKVGDNVLIGEINGKMGYSPIVEIQDSLALVSPHLELNPPKPSKITLIVAMARPKMLKRILRDATMLGVKEIYIINSFKVEKSFWGSQLIEPKNYFTYLKQGLCQAKDTILPKVYFKNRFKPFVEDDVAQIMAQKKAIVAHPGEYPRFPQGCDEELVLAVGPEGGFTQYEIEMFQKQGFQVCKLGSRILRMETAIVSLLSNHQSFFN